MHLSGYLCQCNFIGNELLAMHIKYSRIHERVLCFLTVIIITKLEIINFYPDYTLEILFNNEELGKYCCNNDI